MKIDRKIQTSRRKPGKREIEKGGKDRKNQRSGKRQTGEREKFRGQNEQKCRAHTNLVLCPINNKNN